MRLATRMRFPIPLLLAALTTTCFDGSIGPSNGYLALGTWGGDNVGVIVTDEVTHVHVGCTFGDVPGRWTRPADSRWTAASCCGPTRS